MTEKRFKSIEELLKWIDEHFDYSHYTDNNYIRRVNRKLKERKEVNCSDRVR